MSEIYNALFFRCQIVLPDALDGEMEHISLERQDREILDKIAWRNQLERQISDEIS